MLAGSLSFVHRVDNLVRLHQLGFVTLWPLLGLASVSGWSFTRFVGLVAVMLFFNTFGVVLNDIVDVPVDRSSPYKNQYPLVRGDLTRRQAVGIVLLQLPCGLVAHLTAGFPAHVLWWLVAATICMTLYDLWSKTCRAPLVMDAMLALSGTC